MQFSSFLLFAVLAVSIARCAPAPDAATLSDNAKKAQELNAKFLTLKATDPCEGEEPVCLNGDLATCVKGKFDTSDGKCQDTQQCFAIPNLRAPGAALLCTSESTALSLITAAGGTGGITGSDNSTDGSPAGSNSSTTTTSSRTSSTTTPLRSGSPSDDPTPLTVTVTVFASALSTTTTTTITPSDASSILNKFLTDGQPPSSSTPGLTPAAEPSSTPPASISSSSVSSSGLPVVTLAAGEDSPSPSPSPARVVQLTAIPEESSPSAPTPTPSQKGIAVGGGGGGGYGY